MKKTIVHIVLLIAFALVVCVCPKASAAKAVEYVGNMAYWYGDANYPFIDMGNRLGTIGDINSEHLCCLDKEGITVEFNSYFVSFSKEKSLQGIKPQERTVYLKNGPGERIFLDGKELEDERFYAYERRALKNIANAAIYSYRVSDERNEAIGRIPWEITLHHAIEGEVMIDPLNCMVIPAHKKILVAAPYEYDSHPSKTIAQISPYDKLNVVDYEIHTFPRRYPYHYQGVKYQFLAYRGEGYYSVYKDGKVSSLKVDKGHFYTNSDFWLCLRNQNGIEGWTKVTSKKDWILSKHYGIFHENK